MGKKRKIEEISTKAEAPAVNATEPVKVAAVDKKNKTKTKKQKKDKQDTTATTTATTTASDKKTKKEKKKSEGNTSTSVDTSNTSQTKDVKDAKPSDNNSAEGGETKKKRIRRRGKKNKKAADGGSDESNQGEKAKDGKDTTSDAKADTVKSEKSDKTKKSKKKKVAKAPYEPTDLFVGNIGHYTTEPDLRKFFKEAGKISNIRIPKGQQQKGQNKGFCFVTFTTKEGAEKARGYAGKVLNGNAVTVGGAEEPFTKNRKVVDAGHKVFVGNIGFLTTDQNIREFFTSNGFEADQILQVRVPQGEKTGENKGFCFVHFSTAVAAEQAKELDGMYFNDRTLSIGDAGAAPVPKDEQSYFNGDNNSFKSSFKPKQNSSWGKKPKAFGSSSNSMPLGANSKILFD